MKCRPGGSLMLHSNLGFTFPDDFAALCDEEEMMLGVKHFVAAGHCDGIDGAISAEPEGGEICAVSKGALRLRVYATGRMAHGAMPDHGANPINALVRVGTAVEHLQQRLQERHGDYEHLGRIWLTPTVIAGGGAQYPLEALEVDETLWFGELLSAYFRLLRKFLSRRKYPVILWWESCPVFLNVANIVVDIVLPYDLIFRTVLG